MQYGRWCLQCHVEPPKATTRLEMSAASVSIFVPDNGMETAVRMTWGSGRPTMTVPTAGRVLPSRE